MQYDLTWLLDKYHAGEVLKFIFFWGHTPSSSAVDKSCLSQWFDSPFTVDGIHYRTAEHYMMAMKARLFSDDVVFQKIVQAAKPGEAKALGRSINDFDESIWNEHKLEIVVKGNFEKFSQHDTLASFLLGTGDRVLVEASPVDRVWGIGLAADHVDASRPDRWKGENLLGFVLMQTREQIRNKE